jgi:hypothetical protein
LNFDPCTHCRSFRATAFGASFAFAVACVSVDERSRFDVRLVSSGASGGRAARDAGSSGGAAGSGGQSGAPAAGGDSSGGSPPGVVADGSAGTIDHLPGSPPFAGHIDSGVDAPAPTGDPRGCPVTVSVATRSYGTGLEEDDDYAPRNVGAIWITTPRGDFVRTVTAWGPGYWNFATTWVMQTRASRVDIVTGATRLDHATPVVATWDCRDAKLADVPPGEYRLNVEFTEAESQGPVLTGANALPFVLGRPAEGFAREQRGPFGAITITTSPR